MLYEPPKTKHYIIIGAAAIILVVLLFAIFSIFHKNKKSQIPVDSTTAQEKAKQEKIQAELKKLDEVKKSENSNTPAPTPADIQKELKKLDEAKPNSNVPAPTKEDIQKQLDLLNKAK